MQTHNPNHSDGADGQSVVSAPLESHSSPADAPHIRQHHVPTGFSARTGLKAGIAAALVAAGLAAAFYFAHKQKALREAKLETEAAAAADAPLEVDVANVKTAPSKLILALPGETRAWFESTIYARTSGYVADWTADIGDRVTNKQVLATIDTPELDDQLAGARAKLKASEAEVEVARGNMAFSKSTYDRWAGSPKGVVSEQETEQKKAEYDSSAAKLNAAISQQNLDQADVDRLNELSKFKQVRAPFDGVITARRIDIGDLVTAGSTMSTTSLYSISQSDQIRVFVDVPEATSVGIVPGMPAVATAKEFPDREFPGKVARTSHAIDPVSRTLHVEVDIPNPNLTLLPGMYVQVAFELSQPNSLIQIPASALLFRSAGPQVAVVDKDNKVTYRPVTIVRDQGDVVEIGSGLSPTDRVALNINSQIGDGDHVEANDMDQPTSAAAGSAPDAVVAASSSQR